MDSSGRVSGGFSVESDAVCNGVCVVTEDTRCCGASREVSSGICSQRQRPPGAAHRLPDLRMLRARGENAPHLGPPSQAHAKGRLGGFASRNERSPYFPSACRLIRLAPSGSKKGLDGIRPNGALRGRTRSPENPKLLLSLGLSPTFCAPRTGADRAVAVFCATPPRPAPR